jgi:hypothetical protein
VVARIAPPPPPGAAPQLVLAAVLAERHRRELARLRAGPAMTPPSPMTPPTGPWSPQSPPQTQQQPIPWPEPVASQRWPQQGPNTGGFSPPH